MSSTQLPAALASLSDRDLRLQPRSVAAAGDGEFGLAHTDAGPRLAVLAPVGSPALRDFAGESSEYGGRRLLLCPCTGPNAAVLRTHLAWLRPQTLELQTSAGLGDRLGLATPGHIRAVRAVGGAIAPIFAQQSIREMARTGRTPQEVIDDAMWGVFAEGWRRPFGADADHLKTIVDIDACAAAGYTFYTIDPGEYVDDRAAGGAPADLRAAFDALPWDDLGSTAESSLLGYTGQSYTLEGHRVAFDEETLLRAAVKYGRAIAHVADLYRHLVEVAGNRDHELEISVDETASPTTPAEHIYIVGELRRLGVTWVSLAPRYVGRFEKGVDYLGDPAAFDADFAVHAAIARRFGPYKLSLHSGSDKFSIYEIAARRAEGLVHLKTAGTSYLEALRTIAALDPAFFRTLYAFARERYETDRASYHTSAELDRAPAPDAVADAELAALLDQFDARQILHVTFGSVLTARDDAGRWRFYGRLMAALRTYPEDYAANLEAHFRRHLAPFAATEDEGT